MELNPRRLTPILLLLLLCWTAFEAVASQKPLDPALYRQWIEIRERRGNQAVSVEGPQRMRVLLRERVRVDSLEKAFDLEGTDAKTRLVQTVRLLRQLGDRLEPLWLERITTLGGAMGPGSLRSVQWYWISSLAVIEATPSYFLTLVDLYGDQIEWIEPDADPGFGPDPVNLEPGTEPRPESVGGTEPGLRTTQAPMMWARGYRGRGRLGMNIDTGVWGSHPALAGRWKGLQVPASQAWLGTGNSPTDCGGGTPHGTHVMGTMVGMDPQTQDTVGMAVRSQWIAAGALCAGGSTTAAFQWALDPDGNPNTTTDVPDVINNSWGGSTQDSSQCNSPTYLPLFNALSAAGLAVVFSAGNSGSGLSTITSPKNININEVNVFCTGNVSVGANGNLSIAPSSSRGPSICLSTDSSLLIKPELVAPGTGIRSTGNNGAYLSLTGTSMASPHVSGAVLLLKEAFPNLPGSTILRGLYQSGQDLGTPGEDNTFGNGFLQVDSAFRYLSRFHTPTPPYRGRYNLGIQGPVQPVGLLCSDSVRLRYRIQNLGDSSIPSYRLRCQIGSSLPFWITVQTPLLASQSDTLDLGPRPLPAGSGTGTTLVQVQVWPDSVVEEDSTDNTLQHNLNQRARWTLPQRQNLEIGTLTSLGYQVVNPDNGITWSFSTTSGLATGFRSATVNGYAYTTLGQRDYLETPRFAVPNQGLALLRFRRAYAHNPRFRPQPPLAYDSLIVWASTDCGLSYRRLWSAGGPSLGTTAPDSLAFVPFQIQEWKRDSLDLGILRPATSAFLRFEFVNQNGNNLYLDDLELLVDSMKPVVSWDWQMNGCNPVQVQVLADVALADSLRWYLPQNQTQTTNTVSFSPGPGTHSVTLVGYNRFGVDTMTRSFTVPLGPIADFALSRDTIFRGSLLGLLNQSQHGLSYTWDFGDGNPRVSGFAPQKRYNQNGVYNISLWVTGANLCVDSLINYRTVVVLSAAGVREHRMQAPEIFPNPGQGSLSLRLGETKFPNGLHIRMTDETGRTLSTTYWSAAACDQSNGTLTWEIRPWGNRNTIPEGMYFLHLDDGQGGYATLRYLLQP
ncbi:MAG: S8 family serine peptidase [Bacteroidota bacterium]